MRQSRLRLHSLQRVVFMLYADAAGSSKRLLHASSPQMPMTGAWRPAPPSHCDTSVAWTSVL